MIVVTGATGNVGRALVATLAENGHPVTAVSRGPAVDTTTPGVVSFRADLTKPHSLAGALVGAESLFLLVPGVGEGVDGHALLAAAADAGVRRVVLLSSQAVGTRPGSAAYAPLAALEDAVLSSGLEWTILRPAGFMSNALAWAESIRNKRTVFTPYADVALPVIDPTDIADVAAAALTGNAHHGRTYVLTGAQATTPRERVAGIATALGMPVEVHELAHDQARDQMMSFMPEEVVEATLGIIGNPTPEEQQISVHVPEVLGRPARTFETWAALSADAFR